MTRTAYDEYYGVGLDVAIASNYRLRLPEGENGVACYCLRPSAPGLEVHVPIDGVVSRRADHRDAGFSLIERAGGIRTTSESIAFDWLGDAGRPEFKQVAALLR